jgi:hypothetical protein
VTATHVDGVEVLADEAAKAAMVSRDGSPIYFKQIRELLLADGQTVYGCVHCDYTANSVNRVRPHLNKHRTDKVRGGTSDALLRQLVAKVAELEIVTRERDEYKRRAQAAEKSLRDLRKALGVTS